MKELVKNGLINGKILQIDFYDKNTQEWVDVLETYDHKKAVRLIKSNIDKYIIECFVLDDDEVNSVNITNIRSS